MSSKNDKAAKNTPPSPRCTDKRRPDVIEIHASKTTIAFVCGLLALLILGAAFAGFSLGNKTRPLDPGIAATGRTVAGPSSVLSSGSEAYHLKPGPWGDLECQRTVIEIPDEFLSTRLHEADVPRWFFKGYLGAALTRLLEGAGLSANEMRELLDTSKWETSAAGIALKPSQQTVLSLSSEARKNIYNVLAQFEENPAQEQAFHWPADSSTRRSKERRSPSRRAPW